jgi:uncharacterized protein (DUF697 family)
VSGPGNSTGEISKPHGVARLLPLVEALEKLAGKLPGPLKKPILQEITPVKNLFLRERPPRLAIVGQVSASRMAVLESLLGVPLDLPGPAASTWCEFSRDGLGALHLLDARLPASLAQVESELRAHQPDVVLYLRDEELTGEDLETDLTRALEVIVRLPVEVRLLGLALAPELPADASVQALHALLHARGAEMSARVETTLALSSARLLAPPAPDSRVRHYDLALAEALVRVLPDEAKVQLARLTGARQAQLQIAQALIKSISAMNSAIGVNPIPLADFPLLSAGQALMVAGIMRASGRELRVKEAGEFASAIGANFGIGLVLREGARAAAKFVPGWGNLISGAIAGAGTYAMGKAATAYFIEGKTLEQARSIFKKFRRKKSVPPPQPPKLPPANL